jgi:acyl dehydratase
LQQHDIDAFKKATWAREAGPDDVAPPMMLLALSNRFMQRLIEVRGISAGVNYGTGLVRFNAPVRAGDRLRASAVLLDASEVAGGVQTTVRLQMEIEGCDEPACTIDSLSRWLR